MSKFVLTLKNDKVLIPNGDKDLDEKVLEAVKATPGIVITDLSPYYCDVDIPQEAVTGLRETLLLLDAEIHEIEEPILMEPIKIPLAFLFKSTNEEE